MFKADEGDQTQLLLLAVSLTGCLQNWSFGLKLSVLLQVSFLALLGPMSAAVINPAFVPLGQAFGITTVEASYELTIYVRAAPPNTNPVWKIPDFPCRSSSAASDPF